MPTPDSKTVKFWPVPRKGIWRHVPVYEIPDDALYDSNNVVERDGVLIVRPGLNQFTNDIFNGQTVGATMYYNAANTPVIVSVTTTDTWSYSAGTWTVRTSTAWTGDEFDKARFASIVLGNTSPTSYVIITNGKDAPKKWDGVAATTSLVAGTPPAWTDVTTISDRVIGIKPPYSVSWSPVRNIGSWPALNYHQAAFTPDEVVAIRNLGVQGGVLYKTRSLWTVSPTGLDSDAKAYRFDLYGLYEGPANPGAVVDADGLHVRMTATGRIGIFDGSKHAWVGDGVWPVIKGHLKTADAGLIFGVYDPINLVVYFFYPRLTIAGNSDMRGIAMVTLPSVGRQDFGCFLGTLPEGGGAGIANAGVTYTHPAGDTESYTPVVFVSDPGDSQAFQLQDDTGDDTGGPVFIDYSWQTGLFKLPESYRIEALEVYARRDTQSPNLTVQPVTSWLLADDGALGQAQTVNLRQATEPRRDPIGVEQRARFVGLKFSGTYDGEEIAFKGVSLFGQKPTI